MVDALLKVDGVSKQFSSVLAVDNLSFNVQRGEVFALLGPNGAGKSTTVRMLCGITRPDSGSLTFRSDRSDTPARQIDPALLGYLPEDRGLYGDQKVLPTLLYFAALRGVDRAKARSGALQWLERFGLAGRADDKLNTLSKGNQQKVQFVAAILHEPELAILDEPFSGFDPVNQDLVSSMIRELRAAGMTIILSAHHMDLVETLADHILLMHEGRAVLQGTMAEIRSSSDLGQRLNVTFASESEAGMLPLTELDGVTGVLAQTARSVRLSLHADVPVGRVLHQLTGMADVTGVDTDTPSLREIYLTAVDGDAA